MKKNNIRSWLLEQESQPAQQAPTSDPQTGSTDANKVGPVPQQGGPDLSSPATMADAKPEDNVVNDPQTPEVPEEKEEITFEQWKIKFMTMFKNDDVNEMLKSLQPWTQQIDLEVPQKKFITDNQAILQFRQDANIDKISKELRKLIKQSLDKNSPATSLMRHLLTALSKAENPAIRNILIKLPGFYGMKGELHRKYLASLFGMVQIGNGGTDSDLLFIGPDYTIKTSTRFAQEFGNISIGEWTLKKDEAEEILSKSEMDMLSDGSPEERTVLRRRIMIESIAKKFKERVFLIQVVTAEGNLLNLGMDLSDCIISGFNEGKFIIRTNNSEEKSVQVSENGEMITLLDVNLLFTKVLPEVDGNGIRKVKHEPFLQQRSGQLSLVADMETLKEVSLALPGCFFRELSSNLIGDPRFILDIQKKIPSLSEMLLR